MDNSITSDTRESMRKKFQECRSSIEAMLKQFKFKDQASVFQNMKKLCVCLENVMNVDGLQDFSRFLSSEDDLPIEINFKALRYENLKEIFEDWLIGKQEQSISLERMMTFKYRNIIFKSIMLEQKDTIKDYFSTLSQKSKLKSFDLFQLLTDLLGPYFLYEFNSDTENFFEKINSFESFMKMIESYISTGRRIYIKDKQTPNDEEYIRYHQFQALMEHWQITNSQLTLQDHPRKNMKDASVQTTLTNSANIEVQTDKETNGGYLNLINNTLQQINFMISKQNDPQLLSSLDQIFDVLRTQKKFASLYESQMFRSKRGSSESEFFMNDGLEEVKLMTPSKGKLSPGKKGYEKDEDDVVKSIYKHLCQTNNNNTVGLSELQILFYQLGLVKAHENDLVKNIVNLGFVEDSDEVSLKELKAIIKQLMKQNKRLNSKRLKQYISQQNEERKRVVTLTSFRSQQASHNLMGKNKSFHEGRTTYHLDSDSNC